MVKIDYKAIKSDKYKYQLLTTHMLSTKFRPVSRIVTEYIELGTDGVMVVKKLYAWDGPSGPTIDTKNFMRGSLVHDALYQLMREKHISHTNNRKRADIILRDICRADGMSKIRSAWIYFGVRIGASKAAKKGREVQTAP